MTRREIESESIRGGVQLFLTPRRIVPAFCFLLILALVTVIHGEKRPPAKPIDLNAANAKELQELPGVGPVTAQRIVDLREKSGRFKRVEDLLAVRGVGQKKLDAMRPYIKVSAQPSSPTPSQKAAPSAKKPNP